MKLFALRTQLSNPFDRWDYFKNLGCFYAKLGQHRAVELECTYYSPSLFDVDVSISIREDHAGVDFTIGLLGLGIHFRIYDRRHWNYETKNWEIYNV